MPTKKTSSVARRKAQDEQEIAKGLVFRLLRFNDIDGPTIGELLNGTLAFREIFHRPLGRNITKLMRENLIARRQKLTTTRATRCSGSGTNLNITVADEMGRSIMCHVCGRRLKAMRVWRAKSDFGADSPRGLVPPHTPK